MNRPTFGEGVVVALVTAFVGAVVVFGLSLVVWPGLALIGAVPPLSFAYLIYLVRRSELRAGRLTLVLLWGLATTGAGVLVPDTVTQVLVQLVLLWTARSYCFHRSPAVVFMDLGLVGMGFVAAVWAMDRTGSVFLSIWIFFLFQAFFALLPTGGLRGRSESVHTDPFEMAERTAERSLQRLTLRD